MTVWIEKWGSYGMTRIRELGRAGLLLQKSICYIPKRPWRFELCVQQLYQEGVLSLLIIIISGLFIGMVLALQGYHTLVKFGAAQQLGPLVALSVTRELGPVVAAILFAGRAGTAVSAEIGLMKATEQLSSMEMMAVDPLRRVIAPRFWAGIISLPLLTIIFNATAILGAFWIGSVILGLDAGVFWSNMQSSVNFRLDILNGLYKSIVFGFIVIWVALYQGYFCTPNSEGIAKATTHSIVYSALLILAFDFILTAMMIGDW